LVRMIKEGIWGGELFREAIRNGAKRHLGVSLWITNLLNCMSQLSTFVVWYWMLCWSRWIDSRGVCGALCKFPGV